MGNQKRMAINMIAQIVSFVINVGISFFVTPYVTEHVGKEVYGYVNLAFQATGYVTIITMAINAMLGRYVTIHFSQKDYKRASMYFTSITFANMIISGIMIIPSALVIINLEKLIVIPAKYVMDVKLLWGFIFASFLVGLAMQCFAVSTFIKNRLDIAAKRNMVSNFIKVVVLFSSFLLLSPKVWYIGLAAFICGIFIAATDFYYAKKLTPELVLKKQYVKVKYIKELVAVGIWNSVNQIAVTLLNGCDMLISNLFIGPAAMTLMGYSKMIPTYIVQFVGIVAGTFAPQFTITYANNTTEEFVRQIKKAIKICGFVCSVPVLGFLAFGLDFFRLWLPTLTGKEIMTVQILSVMILAQTIFDVYIFPLYSVNAVTCKLKIPVLVSLIIGIISIIGSVLMIKYTNFGVYSIQIFSSSLLTLRVFLFAPLYAAHILKQKWTTFYGPLLRGILSSVIILIIYFGVLMVLDINNWCIFSLAVVVCGIIGYIVNYFIVLDKEEKSMISGMIKKKLNRGTV